MVARPAAPLAASTPRALPSAWGSAEAKSDGDRRRWRARRSQLRHRLRRYGPGPGPTHRWGGRRLAATWAGVQRPCYFIVPFSGGAGLHHGLSIFASPEERTELNDKRLDLAIQLELLLSAVVQSAVPQQHALSCSLPASAGRAPPARAACESESTAQQRDRREAQRITGLAPLTAAEGRRPQLLV